MELRLVEYIRNLTQPKRDIVEAWLNGTAKLPPCLALGLWHVLNGDFEHFAQLPGAQEIDNS